MCLFMLSRRSWNDPRRAVRDRVPGGRGGRDGGDVVRFFVPGNAIPKQSFRYSRTGGYTDPRVTAWQSTIGYFAELNGVEVRKGKAKVTLFFLLKDRRRRDEIIARLKEDAERLATRAVYWDEYGNEYECIHLECGAHSENILLEHSSSCPITLHRALMKELGDE